MSGINQIIEKMIGVIGSIAGIAQRIGTGTAPPTVTVTSGVAKATYEPLVDERGKLPYLSAISFNADPQVGAALVATITGGIIGPYLPGVHEYQWYKVTGIHNPTLSAISGAVSSVYTPQAGDLGAYLILAARYVHTGTVNNKSPWFYSHMTKAVAAGSSGDITFAWADVLDVANLTTAWNTGANPSFPNDGSGADWTTVDATKPTYNATNGTLEFRNAHRVTGYTETHPPLFEFWTRLKFTGGAGNVLCLGNQNLFGNNASNQYTATGMTAQAGDLNEHVFRLKYFGTTSVFQVDGGTEVVFDESTSTGTLLVMGQTNAAGSQGDFDLKKFQRTPYNTFLTPQQVADKWAYELS